jgi:hypothetical protein
VEEQNFAAYNSQSYDVNEFEEKYRQDRKGDDEATRQSIRHFLAMQQWVINSQISIDKGQQHVD